LTRSSRWQLVGGLILAFCSVPGWTDANSNMEPDQLVQQQIRVTGRVRLATDYIFRGVSQSDEGPAIQGGIDAQFPADFYAGVFLTSVDKPWGTVYSRSGGKESFEFDTFVGLNRSLANLRGHELFLDLGLIHYGFESDPDDLSWSEGFVDLALGGLSARYSSRIAGAPMGDYFEVAWEGELRDWFHYRFHIGRYSLDRSVRNISKYTDASISVWRTVRGFDLGLTWFQNDSDGVLKRNFTITIRTWYRDPW